MKASFKSDAKSIKACSKNLEIALNTLKSKSFEDKLNQTKEFESTVELIEKLSILNEYKLNLFKDFSSYMIQKK